MLTVRVRQKEGRARSLGRSDPVLAAQAAGMKRKINPSFPNSQTISKLEQNSNHHRLRQPERQWKNPSRSSLGGGKSGISDLAILRSNPL